MRGQLHLLQLQVDRLVDSIDELIHASIDRRQNGRLLIYLELELRQQVLIERILRRLHLVEQFHYFTLARIRCLILLLSLLDDLVREFAVAAHELVRHLLELSFLGFELALHILVPLLALHYQFCQEEARVHVRLLQPAERIMRRLELDELGDVRLVLQRARIVSIFHQTVSPQRLECLLHELDRIFVVHLVEEELIEL